MGKRTRDNLQRKVNDQHHDFLHAVILLSMLFRIFIVVIIGAFVAQKTDSTFFSIVVASLGAALCIVIDIYISLRLIYSKTKHPALWLASVILKIVYITAILHYAVRIWLLISFWAYPIFAIFVALLYALDFFIIRKLVSLHTLKVRTAD